MTATAIRRSSCAAITRQPEIPLRQRISVTMDESAQLTGLCRKTIQRAIKKGELKRAKFGRRVTVRVSDLEAWVESRTITEMTAEDVTATDDG